jgi:hypothetical protein
VRAKINITAFTSLSRYGAPRTSFNPNDRVFFNASAKDIAGRPLQNVTVNVELWDPAGEPITGSAITNNGNVTDANGGFIANYIAAGTRTWTWKVTGTLTANGTIPSNNTSGSFDVTFAELYVSISIGGTWKPGDTVPVEVSVRDQNQQTMGEG